MDRREELMKVVAEIDDGKRQVVIGLVEDMLFLESRLTELRKLPFIQVNPSNPAQQRVSPAGKQYKELLQQYNNTVKIMCSALKKGDSESESPLRSYLKSIETR